MKLIEEHLTESERALSAAQEEHKAALDEKHALLEHHINEHETSLTTAQKEHEAALQKAEEEKKDSQKDLD